MVTLQSFQVLQGHKATFLSFCKVELSAAYCLAEI